MRSQTGNEACVFEFGPFKFDRASGVVTNTTGSTPRKLSPQPAALLGLLLENAGSLVSHETIRAHLWPDALVEYDQGVHFCIRQIRTALGESAKSPQYIETLAKRGYKFMAPVTVATRASTGQLSPSHGPVASRRIVVGTLLTLLVIAGFFGLRPSGQQNPAPISLAIMPMVYRDNPKASTSAESLALQLVDLLTGDSRLAVIGPTTTAEFNDEVALLSATEEWEVTFVINGRFVAEDEGLRLLAEVIRASDGAHIWTRWYEMPLDPTLAAQEIESALFTLLLEDSLDGGRSD